jgi:hypothetical protein
MIPAGSHSKKQKLLKPPKRYVWEVFLFLRPPKHSSKTNAVVGDSVRQLEVKSHAPNYLQHPV